MECLHHFLYILGAVVSSRLESSSEVISGCILQMQHFGPFIRRRDFRSTGICFSSKHDVLFLPLDKWCWFDLLQNVSLITTSPQWAFLPTSEAFCSSAQSLSKPISSPWLLQLYIMLDEVYNTYRESINMYLRDSMLLHWSVLIALPKWECICVIYVGGGL